MPSTGKKRPRPEPITYEELLGNAGMSGFVSFLETHTAFPAESAAAARAFEVHEQTLPSSGELSAPKQNPARKFHISRARKVEDGHSFAEQAVYEALWDMGIPIAQNADGESDREVRIGYTRLAQLTRLSWVSVKANLRSLERKLSIEVTGSENSATREGKCYRVYSRHSILERRRKAGLEWVRRTRGVELLAYPGAVLSH